jgi:hypothetical protein
VIVHGRARAGSALSDEQLLRMAIHYYGERAGHAYAARGRAENEVTILIRPRRILEYVGETG